MSESLRAIIIGGGVTGLCAAHYAAAAFGREGILLLEASDYVGGQTRTDHSQGFSCDWGPNGFLDREPATLEWVDGLGVRDRLIHCDQSAARRFILKGGRLHEVVAPPKFFLSPLMSIRGRARLCCEPLVPAKRDDAPESIWNFAARRIGREAADMMVSPMVSGIFGGDAKALSLAHCFPRMAAMERDYGGLVKALIAAKRRDKSASPLGPRGALTSFDGGIGFLPGVVTAQLGDRVRTHAKVKCIAKSGAAWRVELETGETFETQSVLVALPAHAAARITASLDADLSAALAAIPYADMAVVCAGYPREKIDHDLRGFGFLVPRNQGQRVLGCLWTSSLFPQYAPDGQVQFRIMYGGATDPAAVALSDNELLECVRREVHPVMRIACDPEFLTIYRHRPGIPQYTLGHDRRLDALAEAERRHPGLVFAGNAYRGVGLNDCVLSARRAVDLLTA